jgi:M6 family metalloprotease-like protein
MRKLAATFTALLLSLGFATPAESSSANWNVYQKTLATYSGNNTALSSLQKSQIRATLDKTPQAEKFICTGIRYFDQPMSVNIMVRKRAKEACAYAKQLNPSLSTWYQNKPTKARSYAGKVLLTVKSPKNQVGSGSYVQTEALPETPYSFVEGESCQGAIHNWPVQGFLKNGNPAFLECYQLRVWKKSNRAFDIDPETNKPLIPTATPERSIFSYSPMVYIQPEVSDKRPNASLTNESRFTNIEPCRLVEKDNSWPGRPHMVSGFPMAANRAIMDDEVVVQIVPVDFKGYRSSGSPEADFSDAIKAISDFWSRMSDGRTEIEFRVPDNYFSLAGEVEDYGLEGKFPNFDPEGYGNYVSKAVEASDAFIDFSDADVVIVTHTPEVPKNRVAAFIAEAGMPGSSLVAKTNEKTVYNTMIQGNDWPRNIQNWIHEFGHMLGLTDSGAVGNMGFDVMLWYGNPELTVWNRYVLGVQKESQIHCKTDDSSSTHLLAPVAWPGERVEGLVIPLSDSKAIVVESRRRTGYDTLLGKESEGALVYEVDTSKSGNFDDGPFTVIAPERVELKKGDFTIDTPLRQGESVDHAGWKITNVESGAFGDVVKIEKDN